MPLPADNTEIAPLGRTAPRYSARVAWIGLGAMGAPMARVAAGAGFSVTAYDMDLAALEAVVPAVASAGSARDATTGADIVVVMVATGEQLEDVLAGDGGICSALREGATVLVMSTVGPEALERAAQILASADVGLVDAPVSGGVARAAAGDLLVMVSGAREAIDRVRPLLNALAGSAPVVGPRVGDGQRFKVVNQLLCGVHIAAAGEALALAASMGLDLAQVHEVLGAGAAASFMFTDRGRRMIEEDFDEARSALDIFVKDMGIVGRAARSVDQQVPLAAMAEQLYVRGRREGLGRKDDSIVFRLLRGSGS